MKELVQTVVFLVRHGQTDFAYVSDPEVDGARVLTKKGIEQSSNNGKYLAAFAPAAIYSSPLKRTVQTAEAIKAGGAIDAEIITRKELYEIYDNDSWLSLKTRIPKLIEEIIDQHAGTQVVCVTHLDVIEGTLRALEVTASETHSLCEMGEMYRLVFAGKRFVQATKLSPNHQPQH